MADNPSANVIVRVMFSNCWHMHISMGNLIGMMLTKFSVIVMSWTEWQVVQLGTCDKQKLECCRKN